MRNELTLWDLAIPEVYRLVCKMRDEGKCDPDMDAEMLISECKEMAWKLTKDYCTCFDMPDFFDFLSEKVEKEAPIMFSVEKEYVFDCTYSGSISVIAKNREEAEKLAREGITRLLLRHNDIPSSIEFSGRYELKERKD